MEGFRYFIVDDFSPFTCIYLLQKRSKIFYICKKFSQTVRNQFSKTIKIFWSHNALKYKDKPFFDYLHEHGTLSLYSCPRTSQYNGHSQLKHQQNLSFVCAMLIAPTFPLQF